MLGREICYGNTILFVRRLLPISTLKLDKGRQVIYSRVMHGAYKEQPVTASARRLLSWKVER